MRRSDASLLLGLAVGSVAAAMPAQTEGRRPREQVWHIEVTGTC